MQIIRVNTGERASSLMEGFSLVKDGKLNKRCISLVGAGGKTTLLYQLAKEFSELGKRVIVTTTTHLEKPATAFYAWEDGSFIPDLEKQLKKGTFLTVGTPCIHHSMEKIKGIGEETLQKFLEIADVLLVEADGSRRMPVKVPAKHEPVVPHQTEVTIAVLGYPAIGKRIDACAYRSEELAAFLGKKTEDHISLTDVKVIWEEEGGARKGMKGNMLFVLNQCPKEKITDLVEYFKERTEIYLCEKEETL